MVQRKQVRIPDISFFSSCNRIFAGVTFAAFQHSDPLRWFNQTPHLQFYVSVASIRHHQTDRPSWPIFSPFCIRSSLLHARTISPRPYCWLRCWICSVTAKNIHVAAINITICYYGSASKFIWPNFAYRCIPEVSGIAVKINPFS